MTVFANPAQLENAAYQLFNRLQDEIPQATGRFLGSRLLIRLSFRQPETFIWLDGRRPPLEIGFGESRLRPDLNITLGGDTLHHILMGDLSLRQAYNNGLVQVFGPIWRVSVLGDLFSQAQTLYPEIIQDMGLLPPAPDSPA